MCSCILKGSTPKVFFLMWLILAFHASQAHGGFQDFLKGAMKSLGLEQGLTESKQPFEEILPREIIYSEERLS